MRRIAVISGDELLVSRIRAGAADLAQVFALSTPAAQFMPQLADIRPALVLVEIEGSATVAALPQIVKSIATVDPDVQVAVLGDTRIVADVLAAVRAGSSDFIDCDEPIAALSGHIKRCLATLPEAAQVELGPFSVVLNAQSGSASGLFALNLAIARARREGEALFIDCHLPVSEAGAALDIAVAYSLADAVRDTGRLDRTLLLSSIAHHEASGLRVLPLSLRSTDDISLAPETLLTALRAIRPLFRDTVVNAAGIREPAILSALAQWATKVYLVCPQKFTALRDAKDLLGALPSSFDAARRVVLVVDEHSTGISLSPEQMLAAL